MNPPIITLPVSGATLIKYLEEVNSYESQRAGQYIKAEMSSFLKASILDWFKVPPPELDRVLLRRLSNSVLAAGNAGLMRTMDALSELPFEGPFPGMGPAVELREKVSDYREAKNWLFNQSKCVNSVIKFPQLFRHGNAVAQDLATRIVSSNGEDWRNWQDELFQLWFKHTNVAERLRGSYRNNWQLFQGSFGPDMMNGQYRLFLKQQIDQKIHEDESNSLYESALSQLEDSMLTPKMIAGNFELHIEIEGPEVFFYIILNERFDKPGKLNSIKSDLIYELSSDVEKTSTKLALSEIASDFPTLCLRMKKPTKKSDFDAISSAISRFCESL